MQDNESDKLRQFSHKRIKDWRKDEKPRERLVLNGSKSLSDAELLAIIIRDGTKNKSALDISRDLLTKYDNLTDLASCDYSEFKKFKGIGEAKAITLAAVFEISRRIVPSPFHDKKVIRTPDDLSEYFVSRLKTEKKELFFTVLLNSANQVIRIVQISEGSLNASIVHPREVFKTAISESAASIILVHNHPSGNPEPSTEDIRLTRQLAEAGKLIDIKVLDHLIVAADRTTSFVKRGII